MAFLFDANQYQVTPKLNFRKGYDEKDKYIICLGEKVCVQGIVCVC